MGIAMGNARFREPTYQLLIPGSLTHRPHWGQGRSQEYLSGVTTPHPTGQQLGGHLLPTSQAVSLLCGFPETNPHPVGGNQVSPALVCGSSRDYILHLSQWSLGAVAMMAGHTAPKMSISCGQTRSLSLTTCFPRCKLPLLLP